MLFVRALYHNKPIPRIYFIHLLHPKNGQITYVVLAELPYQLIDVLTHSVCTNHLTARLDILACQQLSINRGPEPA
jgi:hypothetical protein